MTRKRAFALPLTHFFLSPTRAHLVFTQHMPTLPGLRLRVRHQVANPLPASSRARSEGRQKQTHSHKSTAAAAAAALVAGAAFFAASRRAFHRPSLTMAAAPRPLDMPYGAELEAAMAAVRLASSLCEVRQKGEVAVEGWGLGWGRDGPLRSHSSLSSRNIAARPSQAT
jgi:hypothetical protein